MASKNDITLDVIWNRPTETFRKNLENVDFSIKLEDIPPANDNPEGEVYRYLEVSPTAFNFVSMAYRHPDHNVKLTFDRATGDLLSAEVLRDS
jgi:hypothetical protein